MKVNKKIIIFAVIIGLLTVIVLGLYLSGLEGTKKNQVIYSQAVVAAVTIPSNVKITADMVRLKSMPSESVHPEAFTSLDKIIGSISNSQIIMGEQILSSRVVTDIRKADLSYRVPENMRAISIPTSEVSGVGGYIKVGDKIDILVTYNKEEINPVSTTYTQLQNIEVAAVGSANMSAEEKEKALPNSITVFVKPAQAEILAYAVSNGSLFFTLRNPVDLEKVNLTLYNSTNFPTYNER